MSALYKEEESHKRMNLRGSDVIAASLIIAHSLRNESIDDIMMLVPKETRIIMKKIDKDTDNGSND